MQCGWIDLDSLGAEALFTTTNTRVARRPWVHPSAFSARTNAKVSSSASRFCFANEGHETFWMRIKSILAQHSSEFREEMILRAVSYQ